MTVNKSSQIEKKLRKFYSEPQRLEYFVKLKQLMASDFLNRVFI